MLGHSRKREAANASEQKMFFNGALTKALPSMDGAHQRLVKLEATAYLCLSRDEAQRILEEAAELSRGLRSQRSSVTPRHQHKNAA